MKEGDGAWQGLAGAAPLWGQDLFKRRAWGQDLGVKGLSGVKNIQIC